MDAIAKARELLEADQYTSSFEVMAVEIENLRAVVNQLQVELSSARAEAIRLAAGRYAC